MTDYYSEELSGYRLKECYDIASARVKQYLDSEIDEIRAHIGPDDMILELGCGYGRIIKRISNEAKWVFGVDTSLVSLMLAREMLLQHDNCIFIQMDAGALAFSNDLFDVVFCVQNGISAFSIDPRMLIRESLRVTRDGGLCVFSSYSDAFWDERLSWFKHQAEQGLLGPIDMQATGNGKIVCEDGYVATTFSEVDFQNLTTRLNVKSEIYEVDHSSVFCIIQK